MAYATKSGRGETLVQLGSRDDRLIGSWWNDTISGADGNDTLIARGGADRLYGGTGDDVLYGETGNDTLYGGSGQDDLYGGSGNDLLYGEEGSDLLVGGTGADAFVFTTRPAGTGTAEMDFIFDFDAQDVVALDNADFPSLGAAGWLPSWMFKVVGNGGVVDSDDRLVYNQRTGVLTYDWNGSATGGRIVLADFTGNPVLTADDFYIV